MPELPEVETVATGVHARVHGRRIAAVWTSGKPQTFKSPEETIAQTLTGARIDSVRRVGKTIVMTVDAGTPRTSSPLAKAEFLIHLGMTGRLLVSQPGVPLPPHTHAVLTLDDAREIRFVDPRRFGRLSVHQQPSAPPARSNTSSSKPSRPRLSKALNRDNSDTADTPAPVPAPSGYTGPGREPLTISLEDFIALFRNRKTPIKAALLNQSLLHGVGNIYADESLFRAGIRPTRPAARLTRAELTRLRAALIEVLRKAISLGGSSVSDYVDADGVRGFFQLEHKVYGRAGQTCLDCSTPLKKLTVGGRTTVFCRACQR